MVQSVANSSCSQLESIYVGNTHMHHHDKNLIIISTSSSIAYDFHTPEQHENKPVGVDYAPALTRCSLHARR